MVPFPSDHFTFDLLLVLYDGSWMMPYFYIIQEGNLNIPQYSRDILECSKIGQTDSTLLLPWTVLPVWSIVEQTLLPNNPIRIIAAEAASGSITCLNYNDKMQYIETTR